MVRRFRRLTAYPSGYSSKLADDQSAVPSQYSPVEPAFDPSHQPDMIPTPIVGTPDVSIVRHVYDSRPPFTYDFFREDMWLAGVPLNGPLTDGFTVPDGYNSILRKISISVFPNSASLPLLTPFGDWDAIDGPVPPQLQLLIDGVQTTTFTIGLVQLFDLVFTDVEFDCFIPIKGGSQFNLVVVGFTDDSVQSHAFNTYVHYYGNTLLSTGRSVFNEVGNQYPQPVIDINNPQ